MRQRFWPPGIPREPTILAFEEAFRLRGYSPCASAALEKDIQKIALFALNSVPTHLAKQLPNGKWTSKLGAEEDIEHSLDALRGPEYGSVVQIYCRPK